MNWLKKNWKKLAKYGGIGTGCLALLVGGFALARYINSGEIYDGAMINLVPTDVTTVVIIDNVPNRNRQVDKFLTELAENENFQRFERTSYWKDSTSSEEDPIPLSVGTVLEEKKASLSDARQKLSSELNAELFSDVLYGELILATDPNKDASKPDEILALQRVTRPIRWKWQFLDIASLGFPEGISLEDGILTITAEGQETKYLALLGDVLAYSNSSRLINGAIANFSGESTGLNSKPRFSGANKLVESEDRKNYVATIWVDLDRMRSRVPSEEQDDGSMKHPIDTFNTLPVSVVSIYPEVFMPLNRIVSMNLDTQLYDTALYGIDISDTSQVKFDQYLVVNEERASWPQFRYMMETLKNQPAPASQLQLLPADTMLVTSYAQEFDILMNDVLDESSRASFVGDFMHALNADKVRELSGSLSKEMMFAALPPKYGPPEVDNIPGTEVPIPPFSMAFRLKSASPEVAREMLVHYLFAQRGRSKKKPGEDIKEGPVAVVQKTVAGKVVYALHDPRLEENIVRRINRSIRAALVGEWLILTNSEMALEYAIKAQSGDAGGTVGDTPGFGELPSRDNATLYVNMASFVGYMSDDALFKTMRDNKYSIGLLEGRDRSEVRREIAESFGLDPNKEESLIDSQVTKEYYDRKETWLDTCKREGDKYEAELREDINGLKFFKDLSLITQFDGNYLHVSGILRLNN